MIWAQNTVAQDYSNVSYGPETRQFLDIYIAPSTCPTPVYFNAHGNGGNTGLPSSMVDSLKALGVSIVSWESLTSVNTPLQVDTGWKDAELMFSWVKSNASQYNFDTNQFIVGGSSRGSILSWKYGHRKNPATLGLYMYNALPDGVWADSSWWYPTLEVNADSPPVFFAYRYEPGITTDIHDPIHGIAIMNEYDRLGIGDRDTLIHSLEYSSNKDRFQFLPGFLRSLISPCNPSSTQHEAQQSSEWKVYPNPLNEKTRIAGLQGNESFTLLNAQGILVKETTFIEGLEWSKLNSGIYFLIIQSDDKMEKFRLLKPH